MLSSKSEFGNCHMCGLHPDKVKVGEEQLFTNYTRTSFPMIVDVHRESTLVAAQTVNNNRNMDTNIQILTQVGARPLSHNLR